MKSDFIDATRVAWQPYYKATLSQSDSIEIVDNYAAYINVLASWLSTKNTKEPTHDI